MIIVLILTEMKQKKTKDFLFCAKKKILFYFILFSNTKITKYNIK